MSTLSAQPEASDLELASSLSRKCSNCGRAGHNSRTCLEKSASAETGATGEVITQVAEQHRQELEKGKKEVDGATSDDSAGVNQRERKKGIAWTEEEHRLFLLGLQKLGKGDWRGISRHYVQTRSPTQVASHAQKYFIRQSVAGKRKRRSSLFDLVPDSQQESEATSVRGQTSAKQAVKEEAQGPQAQVEAPQIAFSGTGQGAEAFAMAYWYQSMLAQQNPLAWLQAMYGQVPQNQVPALAQFMALGQGFIPPPMLQQPGAPFMAATLPGAGQQANFAAQGPALATAFFQQQQQQQFAAALAMGVIPFTPESMAAAQVAVQSASNSGSLAGIPKEPSTAGHNSMLGPSDSNAQAQGSRSERLHSSLLSEQESHASKRSKISPGSLPVKEEHAATQAPATEQRQSQDTHGRPSYLSEPPPEQFGNGALVKPKAYKARPAQTLGELPSYMLGSQETSSNLGGGSVESQSTGLRVSHHHLGSGINIASAMDFSGSTNGGFTGSSTGAHPANFGSDEGSGTRGRKPSEKEAKPEDMPLGLATVVAKPSSGGPPILVGPGQSFR